jgi:hypothetical protein
VEEAAAQLEGDIISSSNAADKIAVYIGQAEDEDDAYSRLLEHCNGDYASKVSRG